MYKALCTSFLVVIVFRISFAQNSDSKYTFAQKASALVEVLNRNHCEPQKIDNVFSEKLFKTFIEKIDPEKMVFTKQDIQKLKSFELLLDDQIKAKNIYFVSKIAQVYKTRINKVDSLLVNITSSPLNFNSKFTPKTQYDSLATSDIDLKTRYQRNLKYSIFENVYYSLLDSVTFSLPVDYLKVEKLKNQEMVSRMKIKDRFRRIFLDVLKLKDEELVENLESLFLQTIANLYDNHSDYFSTDQAEEYLQSGNPESEVFGFSLDENKRGEIIVADLLPGGPAWESGLINEGDLLVSFTVEGLKTVTVLGEDIYEIEEVLNKINSINLTLTLRKPTKEIYKVTLTKKLILHENELVRGVVLEKKDKYGYINLPAFYNDYESDEGLGCANDVAKELYKFKDDNIKGLILDLRYNSGGSVQEALDLAGIFLDQGVFGAAKPQKGKSALLKDPNRGSIYDGPLIVLVNQASASASEILAGILQDYNRAILVGSNTYGKGVAQIVLPLDSTSSDPSYFVKATVLRIFSPAGKAIQHSGIAPDVLLPSIMDNLSVEEKKEPFSLKPIALDRPLYFTPEPKLPMEVLAQKSIKRVAGNAEFVRIAQMSKLLYDLEQQDSKPEELNWEIFCKNKTKANSIFDEYNKDSEKMLPLFKVSVLNRDKERQKVDLVWAQINEKLFSQLAKDIYINEALEILNNLKE